MWFFSAVCLSGAIVTILFIKETKGINITANDHQIENEETNEMLKPREKKAQVLAAQKLWYLYQEIRFG